MRCLRESHGWRWLLRSGRVAGPRGWRWCSDPSRAAVLAPTKHWVAVATANGQAFTEWATRGGERRNTAAYGHSILLDAFLLALGIGVDEAGLISWRSRARRLVDSAARRLDGPSAYRGPVSGAPEVNLRRSARSDHGAELAARCPGGAEANTRFSSKQISRK